MPVLSILFVNRFGSSNPKNENKDNADEPPPSYFNVVSQIRAAKQTAKNPIDLTQKTVAILCQSGTSIHSFGPKNFQKNFLTKFFFQVFFTVFLLISSIVPIASLIVGLISREKCTINPKIPLWLIITGIAGLATGIIRFISNIIATIK
jgi:hypothetical protein